MLQLFVESGLDNLSTYKKTLDVRETYLVRSIARTIDCGYC